MKLNNKGITLTEIIISLALISLVLIFLFSLLVTVNGMNKESEINSTYLINKSLILKSIEEDFRKANTITLNGCTPKSGFSSQITAFYENYDSYYDSLEDDQKASECLKIIYNKGTSDETEAHLGIYYYKNKNSYVISYIHGEIKATRLLPEFEKYNVKDDGNLKKNWALNNNLISYGELNGFNVINIPIIGSDEKDYSIIISYYKK